MWLFFTFCNFSKLFNNFLNNVWTKTYWVLKLDKNHVHSQVINDHIELDSHHNLCSSALLQVFGMNSSAVRITMYFAAFILPCIMLAVDTVVATQELTPQIFSDNYIDLNTCDWNQAMCNHHTFISSGLVLIKKLHELKCVRNIDMDGNYRGYDACSPKHLSPAWYQDKCLNRSELYGFYGIFQFNSLLLLAVKLILSVGRVISKQTTLMVSQISP